MRPLRRSGPVALMALAIAVLFGACRDATGPTGAAVDGRARSTPDAFVLAPDSPVGGSCSVGAARALLETVPVANEILISEGLDHPWAETLARCQYRLFWETGHPVLRAPITFSPEDFFLGGTVFHVPYKNLGMSSQQAAAILDAIEVRIWMAPVTEAGTGELVELAVLTSTLKQTQTDRLGLTVWRQWGFIAQLPPGEYVTVTKVRRPIFFEDENLWTVRFSIR